MKKLSFTNTTVFILFFGMGVVEAIQTKNWIKVIFWFAIGFVFLFADIRKDKDDHSGKKNTN
jgi:hypothetical protein